MSENEKQFVQALLTENAELHELHTALSHAIEQKDNDLIKPKSRIIRTQNHCLLSTRFDPDFLQEEPVTFWHSCLPVPVFHVCPLNPAYRYGIWKL